MVNGSPEGTAGTGPAWLLLAGVRDYLNENYPGWTTLPGMLPEGLRLELHPRAYWVIVADRELFHWAPGADDLDQAFGVPVKVTPDLPEGTWRLVIVTEDVLLGGKLP